MDLGSLAGRLACAAFVDALLVRMGAAIDGLEAGGTAAIILVNRPPGP